eukprot:Pgem_evm1s10930
MFVDNFSDHVQEIAVLCAKTTFLQPVHLDFLKEYASIDQKIDKEKNTNTFGEAFGDIT